MTSKEWFLVCATTLALSACGGGGGDSSPSQENPPGPQQPQTGVWDQSTWDNAVWES